MRVFDKLIICVVAFGLLTIIGVLAYIKYQEIKSVDTAFEEVDTRLGISRSDYNVVRRGAKIWVIQDPSVIQKIKLNAKGRAKLDGYVLSYKDSLQTIGNQSQSVHQSYTPFVDYSRCHLNNGLPSHIHLKSFNEILEDTEDAYTRMQTSQIGRYFEQFCWLGGDYWKMIVDTQTGVIYREYGSL